VYLLGPGDSQLFRKVSTFWFSIVTLVHKNMDLLIQGVLWEQMRRRINMNIHNAEAAVTARIKSIQL